MTNEIYLCGRGKCCPKLEFTSNESIVISEFGQTIVLTKAEYKELVKQAKERGY
jgi:hypothetical protein